MPLPTAQLGQLPSMNLAHSGSKQVLEPAWHKALTALLVGMAGKAAETGVGNVMAPDYTPQAVAAKLPGTSPDDKEQPWYSQVLHGPKWDKTAYQTGMRDQAVNKRLDAQDERLAKDLGLKESELKALNDYRSSELALRQKESGNREAERQDTTNLRKTEMENTDNYRNQQLALEQQRLALEQGRYASEDQRWQSSHDPSNPLNASEVALRQAQIENYNRQSDPSYAARVKMEQLKALGIDPRTLFGGTNATTGQAPTNNSDSYTPHETMTPSVPGSAPQEPYKGLDLSPLLGTPQTPASESPPTTQSISPTEAVQERERANTAAGTSSQMGQSQSMSAEPVEQAQPPITQAQPLTQTVGSSGYPSDALALVRPAQTPNSPTGILPSSASNYMPPITFDPETLRRAALLAKVLGHGQGIGGTTNSAGSGGLPTGYG
jgi:hypothetical protein